MINYSWCGIGQTEDGRVYKCIAMFLVPTERAVYEVWYFYYYYFFWGGGGGGGKSSCEMTLSSYECN